MMSTLGRWLYGQSCLEPLKDHAADDILIIQVNPLHINSLPTSPLEISEWMETVAFNSACREKFVILPKLKN